jgi:hypothetical protein
MTSHVPAPLRGFVIERARGRCEYCLIHNDDAVIDHEVDHIRAEKHGGATNADNLAFACFPCNRYKGTDIASVDPLTGEIVRLYNPRIDRWADHFANDGGIIRPLSSIGRVTVYLLKLNLPERVKRRQGLITLGRWPE